MDPITQNVNANIEEYINSLAAECLQAQGIVNLTQEQKDAFAASVQEYLSQAALEVLVNRLNSEQLSQIENLDPASDEMMEKIQQLAAQVPGLADEMEKRFRSDVEYIKQNSKVPQG
ncbi:hypothetical protein HYS95_00995 [Candidatus Daviesbacteria bacterium]|nr:hypothetical protein [Candidatus Daviesbacteria bacterium]